MLKSLIIACLLVFAIPKDCLAQENTFTEYHLLVFTGPNCSYCDFLKTEMNNPEFLQYKETITKVWVLDVSKREYAILRDKYKLSRSIPQSVLVAVTKKAVTPIKRISGFLQSRPLIRGLREARANWELNH